MQIKFTKIGTIWCLKQLQLFQCSWVYKLLIWLFFNRSQCPTSGGSTVQHTLNTSWSRVPSTTHRIYLVSIQSKIPLSSFDHHHHHNSNIIRYELTIYIFDSSSKELQNTLSSESLILSYLFCKKILMWYESMSWKSISTVIDSLDDMSCQGHCELA